MNNGLKRDIGKILANLENIKDVQSDQADRLRSMDKRLRYVERAVRSLGLSQAV